MAKKIPITKFVLVLLLFISLLSFCIGFFASKIGRLAAVLKVPNIAASSEVSEPLFYKTIGHSPARVRPEPQGEIKEHLYTLELAVLEKQDAAKRLIARMQRDGIKAFYTPVQAADGRVLYRVREGVYDSAAAAGEAIAGLKGRNITAKVVPL